MHWLDGEAWRLGTFTHVCVLFPAHTFSPCPCPVQEYAFDYTSSSRTRPRSSPLLAPPAPALAPVPAPCLHPLPLHSPPRSPPFSPPHSPLGETLFCLLICSITRSFLTWADASEPSWVEKHIHAHVQIAGPTLCVKYCMGLHGLHGAAWAGGRSQ